MNSTILLNTTALDISNSNPLFPTLALFLGFATFIGSLITIYYQNKLNKLNSVQEKLRDDRRKFYFDLLDPFFFLFHKLSIQNLETQDMISSSESFTQTSTEKNTMQKEFLKRVASEDYKKTSAEFILLGSDKAVRAYNDLMQCANPQIELNSIAKETIVVLYATLNLEIRKDFVTKKTKLKEIDVLEAMGIRGLEQLDIPELKRKYKRLRRETKIRNERQRKLKTN